MKTSSPRRFRAGLLGAIALACATSSLIMANILGERFSQRYDVTATGEHKLSPRTAAMLGSLTHDYRLVVATDLSRIDARARERVVDVMDQLRRASARITSDVIDTGRADGPRALNALVQQLANAEHDTLQAQVNTINGAAGAMKTLAAFLEKELAPEMERLRQATPADKELFRTFFDQRAAAARLAAQDLSHAVEALGEPLSATIGEVPVPATDKASQMVRDACKPIFDQLAELTRQLRLITTNEAAPAATREAVGTLPDRVQAAKDAAGAGVDAARSLSRLDLQRVGEALRSGSCVLVIAPGAGIRAVEFRALFPDEANAAGRADTRRHAEELFASAIGSIENPVRPIVVIAHAEGKKFFGDFPIFTTLGERLARRGIDLVEWAPVIEPEPTALATLDPAGARPVVYASFAPDSGAASAGAGQLPGPERAARLGAALTALADAGKPLLISINPSVIATYGQPDPTVSVLERFGLSADSGKPLLREQISAQGRSVETDQSVVAGEGSHPILRAVRGLPTLVPWPVPLKARGAEGAPGREITALATIADDASVWGESQWLRLWQTPRAQRGTSPDLPVFDANRDVRGGPWMVAAAAQIPGPRGTPQRLVVVGSNSWFIDQVTQRQAEIDGRVIDANPGNIELFESSVLWLAGQDDLIAQSPEAASIAIIRPIAAEQLSMIRWAIVAGLPVLVLVVGGLYRVVRG
ncbi:MAG: hypothetical protein IT434_00780 [Phycisphaerales bacterium]|jgi:hypothetical protein|nr:hypothetical protein [Phycisphaerales bacterium]